MEIVYVLQVVTICVSVLTIIINVLITLKTNKQENYNNIITKSRLDFMKQNRDNAVMFIAEANNFIFLLKGGKSDIDLKPLYTSYAQLRIALKPYNSIDKKILDVGQSIITLAEQSLIAARPDELLTDKITEFILLINIYDDADWKFIKQQFNSSNKKSEDFDRICDEIMLKYKQD